jgi:transcriptional regulator with XRE-family HTH domain
MQIPTLQSPEHLRDLLYAMHEDTLGRRIARLRKARGLTQVELAARLDTTQTLVSDYEQDRRRLHAEMIVKVAKLLGVSADELLGSKPTRGAAGGALSLKLTRRLHRIEALPPARQKFVLQTLDTLLKGASS